MVGWGWLIAAWAIGELMGFATVIICMGSGDKDEKNRGTFHNIGRNPLKENKKAADAGTSTAAHMGRKDYFL